MVSGNGLGAPHLRLLFLPGRGCVFLWLCRQGPLVFAISDEYFGGLLLVCHSKFYLGGESLEVPCYVVCVEKSPFFCNSGL